jgi:hypothetical protein
MACGVETPEWFTLSKDLVLELARDNVWLKVPHDTIRDKSKADVLAKSLVCFQVLWMVIQIRKSRQPTVRLSK